MQGFHKILKKHDKVLPHAPCQQFYLSHLHQQSWVQVNTSSYSLAFTIMPDEQHVCFNRSWSSYGPP